MPSRDLQTDEAIMRLQIGYTTPIDAREAGRIIERMGVAYRNSKRRRRDHLAVADLRIGSLIADFVVAVDGLGALLTIADKRAELVEFVVQVRDIAVGLVNGGAIDVPAATRRLLELLVRPVAEGRARDVSIKVIGDNNTIIVIDQSNAEMLQDFLKYPAYIKASQDEAATLFEPVETDEVSLPTQVWFGNPKRFEPGRDNESDGVPLLRKGSLARVENRAVGTALQVGDQWYIRPAKHGGALFPIENAEILPRIRNRNSFPNVSGELLRQPDGTVIGFRVARVR